MPDRRRQLATLRKAVPIKRGLRADVAACLERSQEKLPALASENPDGLFVIERNIDGLRPPAFDGFAPEGTSRPAIRLVGPHDPRLDPRPLGGGAPDWWFADPDWVETELAIVEVLLADKKRRQAAQAAGSVRPALVPVPRRA